MPVMTFQVVSRNSQNIGGGFSSNELEKRLTEEINLSAQQISDLAVIEDWKLYIESNQTFKFFIQFLIRFVLPSEKTLLMSLTFKNDMFCGRAFCGLYFRC